ncbi:MAG: hypothetical protein DMF61_05260 [Blastocatellia bacterium AA13]|nr:MAG: hypothetical protein DMF61_05260 [Blastocatellia bacterium AA13]
MTRNKKLIRILPLIALFALAVSGIVLSPSARAGGPLIVNNGTPIRWPRGLTQGGPLNSQTVNASGTVLYHVDSGPLGTLSNSEATALVDRIFGLYSSIPTANIRFSNAGPIIDPDSRQPVDVNSSNFGKFTSSTRPTFQNPIVFDSDGSITGGGGVLGFFGPLQLDGINNFQVEGFVVLNGAFVAQLGKIPFLGVFTHEFGHFAGPLDHSQINGNIAANSASASLPPGFNSGQIFDLYAPFTETVYPFIFNAPVGSQLRNSFKDSGAFIASLDMDTKNALSSLYPAPGFFASDPGSPNGAIEGRVVVRTSTGDIPVNGIDVIARRISKGAYPPAPGTVSFPNNQVPLDADGVPLPPPAQDATDSLATASSAVTGVQFGPGRYRLDGLPPGDYMVEVVQINPNATGGSGIGPLDTQVPLIVKEQTLGSVTVNAGQMAGGTDIVLAGFSNAPLVAVSEREPNEKAAKAQSLAIPAEVTGSGTDQDAAKLRVIFPGGQGVGLLNDLYTFTLTAPKTVFLSLDPISGSGDMDLYIFSDAFPGKKIPLGDASMMGFGATESASEQVAVQLPAGNYFIGVSIFAGSFNYRLRVIQSQ